MKKLLSIIVVLLSLIPSTAFAEETYTLTEDELFDTICEAVQNDPQQYGVVSASSYEELERDYRILSEHTPDPEKQKKQRNQELIFLGILVAAIIFGYYKLYIWGKRKEEEASNKAYDSFLNGYNTAKEEYQKMVKDKNSPS